MLGDHAVTTDEGVREVMWGAFGTRKIIAATKALTGA